MPRYKKNVIRAQGLLFLNCQTRFLLGRTSVIMTRFVAQSIFSDSNYLGVFKSRANTLLVGKRRRRRARRRLPTGELVDEGESGFESNWVVGECFLLL